MDYEKESLEQMGAFKEVELPPGERVIGLKWVYAYKMNAEGVNIKKKARVVAQRFNQRPGQFGETYAPVAKMASKYFNSIAKPLFFMPSFVIPYMLINFQDIHWLILQKSYKSWSLCMDFDNLHTNFICC
jgi:Reverse transcriptase (RNA-dependent DNA polymerase)